MNKAILKLFAMYYRIEQMSKAAIIKARVQGLKDRRAKARYNPMKMNWN